MSEKSSGAKSKNTGASSDSKSATPDKKSEKSSETAAKTSDDKAEKSTESTDSSEPKAESTAGKSQKQTVSEGDVHYGYFSSVRSPAYRKGWDDIFAKKKTTRWKAKKTGAGAPAKKRANIKPPITLELDINELPDDLRTGLGDEIRRQTKRRRINYDKLDAAGAVRWRITCDIKR